MRYIDDDYNASSDKNSSSDETNIKSLKSVCD